MQIMGKINVFRGTRNFRKPDLAKMRKPRTPFFLQFSLKGADDSVSLGLRQLLLRRAGFGWGTAPGKRNRYTPIDPGLAFPPLPISRNSHPLSARSR